MNAHINLTNRSAFKYATSVDENIKLICEPIKCFGLSIFGYLKIFRDGTYLNLSNGPVDYQKQYFENISTQGVFFTQEAHQNAVAQNKVKYCIWPSYPNNDKQLRLLYEHNMWHGFSLYYITQDYIEFGSFTFNRNYNGNINFFINHLDTLAKFFSYFKLVAKDIINCADRKKLAIYPAGVSTDLFYSGAIDQNEKRFYESMYSKKEQLLHSKESNIKLSPREWQCIQGIKLGKSYKELANDLSLSYRTVESYINNIKNKTGKIYKSEIRDFF